MIPKGITTILFDLGGVIINLYPERSSEALAKLSKLKVKTLESICQKKDFFNQYETGKIDCQNFLKNLNDVLGMTSTEPELRIAWNAMLGYFPMENFEVLETLRRQGYKLLMLSNTNVIHIEEVHKRLHQATHKANFTSWFDRVYYSQEIGLRKPEKAPFKYILADQNLNATEVLFLDDNAANVAAAASVGMQTIHWPQNRLLTNLLPKEHAA